MKKRLVTACLMLFISISYGQVSLCVGPESPDFSYECWAAYFESGTEYHACPGAEDASGNGGYVLTFDEEFNGSNINTNVWQTLFYGYCHALIGNMFNNPNGPSEFEYYSPNNLSVSGGILNITSKTQFISQQLLEDGVAPNATLYNDQIDLGPNLRDFNYTSGCLQSIQKFPCGLYQMRCKMPNNTALWPAFWLRYDGWYQNEEIDAPDYYSENDPSDDMIYHCNLGSSICDGKSGNIGFCVEGLSSDWHTLSIQWDRYYTVWMLDDFVLRVQYSLYTELGQAVLESDNSLSAGDYFRYRSMPVFTNMNILANVAVRFPNISSFGDDPATMQIDWIKGYSYMDCNSNMSICNWDPDRTDPNSISGNFEDPTVYTGNTITVAGDPSDCQVNVYPARPYYPHPQFLNLYAATAINLENGFTANSGSNFSASIIPCENLYPVDMTKKPKRDAVVNSNENSFRIFPNPAKAEVKVTFALADSGMVKINVFDEVGNQVGSFFNNNLNRGNYSQLFSVQSYPQGVYFVKLQSENYSDTKKVVILN